jgi:hypothetical protein
MLKPLVLSLAAVLPAVAAVDFVHDVQPILKERCSFLPWPEQAGGRAAAGS